MSVVSIPSLDASSVLVAAISVVEFLAETPDADWSLRGSFASAVAAVLAVPH